MTNHPLIERARTSPVPVAALIGFSIEPLGDGKAVGRLEAGPQHANPMGTLHGGILCDVADAAMGMAFVTTLKPDESFTTMSLAINFFRPVWEAHRLPRVRHYGSRRQTNRQSRIDVRGLTRRPSKSPLSLLG